MNNSKTKMMSITAVLAALVFIVTRFIQIPIPLGYFNVGNSVILLGCLVVPSPYGLFIGSVGSAFADLTSYPVYTLPTFIIKLLMPLVFYKINNSKSENKYKHIIAAAVSTLIPLFGYTITGGIIYQNMITGLTQFPGLLAEYVANLVIFALAAKFIKKMHI